MLHRRPLRTAAVSALALCAAGCAGLTGSSAPEKVVAAKKPAASATPTASTAAPGTTIEAQLASARALRLQGHLPEATKALAQLVLVAPDNGQVIAEYGKALVQQGRAEDAIAFLKHAAELRPQDATIYSALGVAYDQNDDRKNAKTAYERALLLQPNDPGVLNNYGVSRMLAGDLDGAEKLLLAAQAAGARSPKLTANLKLLAEMKTRQPAKGSAAVAQGSGSSSGEPRAIVVHQVTAKSEAGTAGNATKPPRVASTRPAKSKIAKKAAPPPPPALRTAAQGE